MDLDRWKDRLRGSAAESEPHAALGADELAAMLRKGVRDSRRAVRRAFFRELTVIALIYTLAAAVVIIFGQPLASFQLKIVVLSAAGAVPVIALFVRYLAGARSDLGRPVLGVVNDSIRGLRAIIRVYRWAGLTLAAAMATALWTDAGFRDLPPGWKWGVTAYILVAASLSIPYLRAVYGRRLRELEDLSRDAEVGSGASSR
jgi:hypothetical protein